MTAKQRWLWIAVGALAMLLLVGGVRAARFVWVRRDRIISYTARRIRPQPSATAPQGSPTPLAEAMSPTQTPEPQTAQEPTHETTRANVPLVLRRIVGRALIPLIQGQEPTPTLSPTPSPTPTRKKTKTPKPTPTPVMPWPEPLAAPGRSKLGLHVQWNNSPEIMEFVRRMKPAVVKAVGDFGFLADLKEASPTTVVVARLEEGANGHRFRAEGDPVQAARAFVGAHLQTYQANPLVDYWEGPNEPDVKGQMAWYALFEAERARLMAENGMRVAVGTFSAGVPEWDEFVQFLPAIEAAKRHGGILALHEYDAPTLDRSVGAGLPGRPNHPDRGALALRYRWWYEDLLKPRGLAIPLVISEAGVDGLISNRPGPTKARGWRDFASYWRDHGLGADPIPVYLRQLAWYDGELQKDSYVIGCAIFTVGPMDDDWDSYDVTDILRHIATYIIVPAAK